MPGTFADLVASRKVWLEQVLKPWCLTATRTELRTAELDWVDLAGKVAPEKTLWVWAWSRFPGLVQEELGSIDETRAVTVRLRNGEPITGYPDARESTAGQLVLLVRSPTTGRSEHQGPFSIDDIDSIQTTS